jgi:hypothetical protein
MRAERCIDKPAAAWIALASVAGESSGLSIALIA